MAGTGGKRIGAGRPKGTKNPSTIKAEEAKQLLIQAYLDNVQPINDKLVEMAKTGDMAAIKELHERVYGKTPQAIEHKGQVKMLIAIDE